MVRVLIVDDSSFVRGTLKALLEQDPEIKVVGMASDGLEAIEKVKELDPDLVTLDIEMPRMDGLKALQEIMSSNPCPVIMVSSLTVEGAASTFKALELGALDYFGKPTSGTMDPVVIKNDLTKRVKELSRRKTTMRLLHKRSLALKEAAKKTTLSENNTNVVMSTQAKQPRTTVARRFDVVCIGVSTGGPPAVQKLLSQLPKNFPVPILIAQHMPAAFTGPFAYRLNSQCKVTVQEANENTQLQAGTVYICKGGMHLRAGLQQALPFGFVSEEPKDALYKPSANVLFESVAESFGRRSLCLVLTGMGNDGLEGAKLIRSKGGYIMAQSEESCVVYGMPKAIVDAKLADEVADIDGMAQVILSFFNL